MKTNYMLEKAMDASWLRNSIIADNIANVDTPGFKKSFVTFEAQLDRALRSEEEMKKCPQPYLTDKKHITFNKPLDYLSVRPRIQVEYDTNFKNDKNNVDIDKEVSDLNKNTLCFKMLATCFRNNYRMLNSVLA